MKNKLICVKKPRMKISVSTDISVLGFYGYIRDISVDIFTRISIYQKLNYYNQSITVGSSQDFKSGHLNISSIYPDIFRIFYRKIKTCACATDLIFPRYISAIYRRYRVEHHRYRTYRKYIERYIGYFHPWKEPYALS